jgi:hypothetical protein
MNEEEGSKENISIGIETNPFFFLSSDLHSLNQSIFRFLEIQFLSLSLASNP